MLFFLFFISTHYHPKEGYNVVLLNRLQSVLVVQFYKYQHALSRSKAQAFRFSKIILCIQDTQINSSTAVLKLT